MGFTPGLPGWHDLGNRTDAMHRINKIKNKSHTIITDAGTALDKLKHPFMAETLNKMGIKGKCLNIISATYDKPHLTSYSVVKSESFSSWIREKHPPVTTPIQHVTGGPSQSNQATERNTRHANWERRNKVLLRIDNVILYMKNPKDLTLKTTRNNKQV